jgi:quercetin 2,3-dioxygenase
MKLIFHPAHQRGYADHGWLKSHHSFSFAGFHDPLRMGFGALRVLNDDTVAPGHGFGQHPHKNMEIISIPLEGDLHHHDNTGRDRIIHQGDVQIMSAGKGIVHSEINGRTDQEVKFLQIWIYPKERDIEPRYDQRNFRVSDHTGRWQTVVAPNEASALSINQDAWLSIGRFNNGSKVDYKMHIQGNGVYVFIIEGAARVNDVSLAKRDAVGILDTDSFSLTTESDAEILLIEIPME